MLTPQDLEQIYSEEWADLLITYNGDMTVFDNFPGATIHIINYLQAVVHVPVNQITETIILEQGYGAMPPIFGIVSEASIEASGVRRLQNIPAFNLRGQGVLIGIIDSGIDYTNPIFRYADNTTRIVSIWDQTIITASPPEHFFYGAEFSREEINIALQSPNPLEIVPSVDLVGHGTMLAGVAGGNEVPEDMFAGVAPEAEFVVVKLKPAKQYLRRFFQIPDGVVAYQGNDVIFGLDYLLDTAIRFNRPMVICIALGSQRGPHDGRGIISGYLSLLASVPSMAVLVAAGNEGNARRHFFGIVDRLVGYETVELNVGENEPGFSMELWGTPPSIFSIDILTPSGEFVPRIAASLVTFREISFVFEETIIFVDFQMVESQSGDQLILLRFVNPTPGIWRFNVYERGDLNLGFHIWLPKTGFISEGTYFIRSDPYTTLLNLANAEVPITVTAYNHLDGSLFLNASRGFTRIGFVQPTIAAPGVNIIGPNLQQGFSEYTGTSVATAHAVGISALIMEWGNVRGNLVNMNTVELKKLMMRGARRSPELSYPNRDWGYGMLDIYNTFDSLRGIVL